MQGKIGHFPDGFTYREGRKEVLVFPDKSEKFATDIDKRLGGAHVVEHTPLFIPLT